MNGRQIKKYSQRLLSYFLMLVFCFSTVPILEVRADDPGPFFKAELKSVTTDTAEISIVSAQELEWGAMQLEFLNRKLPAGISCVGIEKGDHFDDYVVEGDPDLNVECGIFSATTANAEGKQKVDPIKELAVYKLDISGLAANQSKVVNFYWSAAGDLNGNIYPWQNSTMSVTVTRPDPASPPFDAKPIPVDNDTVKIVVKSNQELEWGAMQLEFLNRTLPDGITCTKIEKGQDFDAYIAAEDPDVNPECGIFSVTTGNLAGKQKVEENKELVVYTLDISGIPSQQSRVVRLYWDAAGDLNDTTYPWQGSTMRVTVTRPDASKSPFEAIPIPVDSNTVKISITSTQKLEWGAMQLEFLNRTLPAGITCTNIEKGKHYSAYVVEGDPDTNPAHGIFSITTANPEGKQRVEEPKKELVVYTLDISGLASNQSKVIDFCWEAAGDLSGNIYPWQNSTMRAIVTKPDPMKPPFEAKPIFEDLNQAKIAIITDQNDVEWGAMQIEFLNRGLPDGITCTNIESGANIEDYVIEDEPDINLECGIFSVTTANPEGKQLVKKGKQLAVYTFDISKLSLGESQTIVFYWEAAGDLDNNIYLWQYGTVSATVKRELPVQTYTLTYDTNKGNADGPAEETGLESGTTVTLNTDTVPTHNDDNDVAILFVGWTEKPDEKIYAKGDEAPKTVTEVAIEDHDVTVWAVWGYDKNKNGKPDVLEEDTQVEIIADRSSAVIIGGWAKKDTAQLTFRIKVNGEPFDGKNTEKIIDFRKGTLFQFVGYTKGDPPKYRNEDFLEWGKATYLGPDASGKYGVVQLEVKSIRSVIMRFECGYKDPFTDKMLYDEKGVTDIIVPGDLDGKLGINTSDLKKLKSVAESPTKPGSGYENRYAHELHNIDGKLGINTNDVKQLKKIIEERDGRP